MPPRKIQFDTLYAVESELQSIREKVSITETEESWDSIAKAIQRFSTLIQESSLNFPTEISSALRGLARPINSAATSERSRLSGVAVDLLKISAESLGKHFTLLIPLFFPTLLGLCARSNKVFISRAKACVLSVIEATHSPTILPYLVEAAKDKISSLRLAAAEFSLACLNGFNPPDLEKEARSREVEALIKCTATDASADVRRVGKKLFEAYTILLPHRVDNFTGPLTPTIRKYLSIHSRAPSNTSSNPPSRPTSSMSMNSINSAHSGSRPKSTVPPSTTTVHLARSIGFNNLEGQSRNRATSRTSAQVPRSESAPVASQSTSTTQHLPPAAATRSTVGPSRPQLLLTSQKVPSRAIPERDIPPPQSAPLRPPPSFESAPKIMVAMRPDPAQFTGPSSFVVPSGPQRPGLISGSSEAGLQPHRVIGGARRVPLPPPPPPLPPLIEPTPVEISPLIKEATNARVPKQSTKSSHSRITSANAKSEDKKSPVTKSEDAPPAKLKAARKPDPQKPKAQPPPVVVATALSSSSTAEKHAPRGVKKPEAPSTSSVTTRRRGASSSRLTEPTQAQLARQKPAKHPSSQKHDPVKSTWGRSTTTKNLATKTSSSSRRPVSSIAAKSPLAASESAKQPQSAGQSDSKPAPASIPLPPSRSPTPPPQPEPEEVLTIEEIKESPVSPVLSPPIEPVSNDPPLPPQDAVENDEEEFIEESTMKPDTCTSVHLITFDSPTPSTPKAMFPRPQQVPETPISSLLASIENDLELSPAPPFDPDQTFTFGGLLQIERCEPLLLGRR